MGEKHLIAIPCCTTKSSGGTSRLDPSDPVRISNRLPPGARSKLEGLRAELAAGLSKERRHKVDPGRDLGGPNPPPPLRPAYERFRGLLYREIPPPVWRGLLDQDGVEVVIVSSLYGLLDFREPIRDYDLHMDGDFRGTVLKGWWKEGGLPEILGAHLESGGHTDVHNYLSGNYNDAVGDLKTITPEGADYHRPNIKAPPMQANKYRGRDLVKILERLGVPSKG